MEDDARKSLEGDTRKWFFSRAKSSEGNAERINQEIARRLKPVEVGESELDPPYRIEPKMCFNNAMKVAFADRNDFVLGFMIDQTVPVPVMHAWNGGDDGDFDLTVQLGPLSPEDRVYLEIMRAGWNEADKLLPPDDCPFWDQHLIRVFMNVANGEGPEGITVPDVQSPVRA